MKRKANSKTDRVIEDILSYIIEHQLVVGDKLPAEGEMTTLFGVSRICIREALQGLKFLGFVVSSTKGGTRIKKLDFSLLSRVLSFQIAISNLTYYESTISNESYDQLLEARCVIELGVLEIIIKKITQEEVEKLERFADCEMKDDSPEQLDWTYKRDCEFHRTLLEISENGMLKSFTKMLDIFFLLNRGKTNRANSKIVASEHQNIVQALKDHNLELARGIMRHHLGKYKGEKE
ncbi:MAG: FCD domain-containing protein [Lentisphaeria bacterium]